MKVRLSSGRLVGLGWHRDLPDFRDYTEKNVVDLFQGKTRRSLPDKVDLRRWCSPVEDQRNIGACTAHAVVGVVEYYERRRFRRYINHSRLFLYKVTRNLLHLKGDTGAYLRTTMAALKLFGVPPEEYWPYDTSKFDEEPPAFCYAFAQNFQAVRYFRHDPPGRSPNEVLESVKSYLRLGVPAVMGFVVFADLISLKEVEQTGQIPYPSRSSRPAGGHAVMVVGYDDNLEIINPQDGVARVGAFLIRNSWGTAWGEDGYGWLPYDYLKAGLAVDWWSLVEQEWVNLNDFDL